MTWANVVAVAHAAFVAFMVWAPFSRSPRARVAYLITAPVLWLHWAMGDSTCALTMLETRLRGLDGPSESFVHRLVAPVYEISDEAVQRLCWVATVASWAYAARRTTWDEVRDVLGVP